MENENKGDLHPHFMKKIEYNDQPWLTDFIFGQRGSNSHGHGTLSGAEIWYLIDEKGIEIIKNGSIILR